jgi:hypothetical protein
MLLFGVEDDLVIDEGRSYFVVLLEGIFVELIFLMVGGLRHLRALVGNFELAQRIMNNLLPLAVLACGECSMLLLDVEGAAVMVEVILMIIGFTIFCLELLLAVLADAYIS